MNQFVTVIMAAGKGTRMKSDLAKVLHPLLGRPMIHYVIQLARELGSERVMAIIGHQKERVREELAGENIEFAVQEPQLGTGHAIMQVAPMLSGYDGDVLILSGDVPLLTYPTMRQLLDLHTDQQAAGTVLTTVMTDATGYGRVLRGPDGRVKKIVEHRDATEEELRVLEINAGIYVFRAADLFPALNQITPHNAQREYYLPDVLKILMDAGRKIAAHTTTDFHEISGINTVEQLFEAETLLSRRPT